MPETNLLICHAAEEKNFTSYWPHRPVICCSLPVKIAALTLCGDTFSLVVAKLNVVGSGVWLRLALATCDPIPLRPYYIVAVRIWKPYPKEKHAFLRHIVLLLDGGLDSLSDHLFIKCVSSHRVFAAFCVH